MTVEVFAPAKINLTLHITGQRVDGYHLLDSLVAFGTVGDHLTISDAKALSLVVKGPEASGVPGDASNLVLKAAEILAQGRGAEITLNKYLPTASGIGGGSADAAAAIRGLLVHWGTDELEALDAEGLAPFADQILSLGADVPMCLYPSPVRAKGIGENLTRVENLPILPVVLLNPRIPVSTPEIFAALSRKTHPPMSEKLPEWSDIEEFCMWLGRQRNDLQKPTVQLYPGIAEALSVLEHSTGALLARMSGSGATCFAIYPDTAIAKEAAARIAVEQPEWWLAEGIVGSQFRAAMPVVS